MHIRRDHEKDKPFRCSCYKTNYRRNLQIPSCHYCRKISVIYGENKMNLYATQTYRNYSDMSINVTQMSVIMDLKYIYNTELQNYINYICKKVL